MAPGFASLGGGAGAGGQATQGTDLELIQTEVSIFGFSGEEKVSVELLKLCW